MTNQTGRLFECLSLKGPESSLMSDYFTIGKKYLEADVDILGGNQCDETSVLLYSDYLTTDGHRVPMYMDLMDFEFCGVRGQVCLN